MGMYDSVLVPCPKCGTESEFQSKSGNCDLTTYKLAEAPLEVLTDINRHAPNTCEKCGTLYGVEFQVIVKPVTKATPIPWPPKSEQEEDDELRDEYNKDI